MHTKWRDEHIKLEQGKYRFQFHSVETDNECTIEHTIIWNSHMNVIDVDEMFGEWRRGSHDNRHVNSTSLTTAFICSSPCNQRSFVQIYYCRQWFDWFWCVLCCVRLCDSRYDLRNSYQICVTHILIESKCNFLHKSISTSMMWYRFAFPKKCFYFIIKINANWLRCEEFAESKIASKIKWIEQTNGRRCHLVEHEMLIKRSNGL